MIKLGPRLNNKGDTIIEVLIAILILSLVLTGAYSSSNQSLKMVTEAEQRTIALNIAQNQIEDLRAQAATPAFKSYLTVNSCFNTTTNTPNNFLASPVNNSNPCVSKNIYLSEIIYLGANILNGNAVDNSYEIIVSWASSANDKSNAQVILYYRVAYA